MNGISQSSSSGGGKPAIALIEANELCSMMELVHLLRSPADAKRLIEASEEVSSGSHRET
jgi:antitoxin YefM